jgi:parvulin-like peptidyl-prolyl isomerase
MRARYLDARFVLLLVIMGAISGATSVVAQSPLQRPGERPWDRNVGAGGLTTPGRSRVLPPVTDDVRTARLPTDRSGGSREMLNHDDAEATGQSPEHWWQEEAERTISHPESGLHGRGVSPRGEIIVSTQILAMVGNQPILAGDLLGRINELLEPYKDQAPEEQLEQQRWLLMEKMLPSAIESKMVFLDFIRNLEKERIDAIRTNIYKQYDEKQLPKMVEQAKLNSTAELEDRLRALGSSIESSRRSFFEQVAAREMIRREGEDEREVTHDDLLAHYRDRSAEFDVAARARWEQLTVKFSAFPTKRDAYKALADMGNAVLRGARLDAVARKSSQGPTARNGGQHDWTTRGSLVSTVLDEAIFELPVGKLSDILEDDDSFHIVRVIEREAGGLTPFVKAQVAIRDKIKDERREVKVKEYLERLKRDTYVWNYFDDVAQQARVDRAGNPTRK